MSQNTIPTRRPQRFRPHTGALGFALFLTLTLTGAGVCSSATEDPPADKNVAAATYPPCPWNHATTSKVNSVPSAKNARRGSRTAGQAAKRSGNSARNVMGMNTGLGMMPEPFRVMMETFTKNPEQGFAPVLKSLAGMEESALGDVRITLEEERLIGRNARTAYLDNARKRGYPVWDNAEARIYMETLISRALRHWPESAARYPKREVTFIHAPISDAHAFPGGYFVFTTAVLQEPDEDTVMAVVAHEVAHLTCGHLTSYARRAKYLENSMQSPQRSNPMFAFSPQDWQKSFTKPMATLGLMLNPYRPEHEHEADCRAVEVLHYEGYAPLKLADFFARLGARQHEPDRTPFGDALIPIGRSHPYSRDRQRHVEQRAAQLARQAPRPAAAKPKPAPDFPIPRYPAAR